MVTQARARSVAGFYGNRVRVTNGASVTQQIVSHSRLFTMDFGGKLEELNLTRDEMSRLGHALKDQQFRELLREYTEEISSPENRREYEEEIARLEEQRGVSARFLHPEPHHVLKTRDARGKLFINICSDPLIDKPMSEAARDRDGTPGHRWRIPYSLTPGRPDRDAAGNGCVTHDVIFHPDALRLAGSSGRIMKLLHSTAIGGIEDSFHVTLEKHNIKQLQMKYKGVPQAALIRRPVPGAQQNRCEDPLSFPGQSQTEPEPDQSQTEPEPDQSQTEPDQSQTEPEPDQSQTEPDQSQTEPELDQSQTEPEPGPETQPEPDSRPASHQPTVPQYTVKYRSVVDLQDYRCSRDSGPGARPTEIIIIIDLPLLGSAGDAKLSVKQRRLVLESQNPAYKLDLPLSYPVDEDKGHATFNRTTRQLTVSLCVRPASSQAEPEPKEDDPEPKSDCSTLTRSAELQPSASEPQITASTTEPQTLSDPAQNRTEPQTVSDPAPNRTEPQTLSDPVQNRTEPQTLSDPAPNRTEPQTLSDPAPNRTEPQTLSDPAPNRTEPQTLSDPAPNQTEPQTLSDPAPNRTEPQTLSDPAPNRTEPQTLSDPAPNRTEPQTHSDPTPNRTKPQTLSDPAPNRTEPQTLSDPAPNRTEPQTHSDPTPNRTEPQTHSDPTPNRTEPQTLSDPAPNRTELDQICSVETADGASNTCSSASGTTASGDVSGAPETESLMTHNNTAINQQPKTRRSVCFQNSLRSDLD